MMDPLPVPFQDTESRLRVERQNTIAKLAIGGALVIGWVLFMRSSYADFGETKTDRRLMRMNPKKRRRLRAS
jgi:hypothetical protein